MMNKDRVIQMAQEAGPLISTPFNTWCERFAALAYAQGQRDMREAAMAACTHRQVRDDWDDGVMAAGCRDDIEKLPIKEVK